MKILVTGAAGFIGYHLVHALSKLGYQVIGLDNINDYYDQQLKYSRLESSGIHKVNIKDGHLIPSLLYSNYSFIKIDLEDRYAMEKIFENEEFTDICHLAAQAGVRYSIENPDVYISSNILGFYNLLECCRRHSVKNLTYASSSSVYGLNKDEIFKTTDKTDRPASLYAATKKSNELMAHAYSHLYGIRTRGLRLFTVYGPWGRPDMAPMLFTSAILKGQAIKVFNYGDMKRDFTFIDDVVNGIVKVIENKFESSSFRIYNIGNNSPVNLLDFIIAIEESLDITAKKEMLPLQKGDVKSTCAYIQDFIDDFGYIPTTGFKEGIDRLIAWYKGFYGHS